MLQQVNVQLCLITLYAAFLNYPTESMKCCCNRDEI